jgi:hypothetical protein
VRDLAVFEDGAHERGADELREAEVRTREIGFVAFGPEHVRAREVGVRRLGFLEPRA